MSQDRATVTSGVFRGVMLAGVVVVVVILGAVVFGWLMEGAAAGAF